jgi:hypothetical protein
MVFIFHPVVSFILPLAVACLLCPPLRRLFPDLAWLTGQSRAARVLQGYLVLSFVPVMAMNSGGPVNFAANVAFLLIVFALLLRLARSGLAASDGRRLVAFGPWGFAGLCIYLALLYGVTYPFLRPGGLPSVAAQLLTCVFYAVVIIGLCLYRRRAVLPSNTVQVEERELRLVRNLFGLMLLLALVFSAFSGQPILILPIIPNFVIWTVLGFVLTAIALFAGVLERMIPSSDPSGKTPVGVRTRDDEET